MFKTSHGQMNSKISFKKNPRKISVFEKNEDI